MRRNPRELQNQFIALDNTVGTIHGWSNGMIILPVLTFLCLALLGCEAQENASMVIAEPMNKGSEAQFPRSQVQHSSKSGGKVDGKRNSLPRIVAFGNSLTAGLGVSLNDSYPGRLASLLEEKGFKYEVINAGVSGETSAGGVRRIDWILKSQPALVILELGANDGLRGQSLQQTYENLKRIIEKLQDKGVVVVLAGMQLPRNYGADYTNQFSGIYERLAREFDAPLIPFLLEGVAASSSLNQGDGIHPNAEGYRIVVQNVWKTLQPLLKRSDTKK